MTTTIDNRLDLFDSVFVPSPGVLTKSQAKPPRRAAPIAPPAPVKPTIESRFLEFHRANPRVYETLVTLARSRVQAGHKKIGIGMLWERMRWEFTGSTISADFKLNNNLRSHYARAIMSQEPDLAGVFDTRELRSA